MAQVRFRGLQCNLVALGCCTPSSAPVAHRPKFYGTHSCGAATTGKTTLLEVLAGKHMVGRDAVRILGRPAFYDLMLVTSGELGYLGNQWRRSVACAGSSLTLQVLTCMRKGGRVPCCNQLPRCVLLSLHDLAARRSCKCDSVALLLVCRATSQQRR